MSPTAPAATLAAGDRRWAEAGASILAELSGEVRDRAKAVRAKVEVDPVHDMRTATRRLRTAIAIYGDEAPEKERKAVERGLRRATRRLGVVRDLDVLLQTLGEARTADGDPIDPDHLRPLRRAWERERRAGARKLAAELGRRRFRRSLDRAERLVRDGSGRSDDASAHAQVPRVAGRAPALIWSAFGDLLAFEIDPRTADPAVVHELRMAAKTLRYTLEAFEDALAPGPSLIDEVIAIHDAGGEMHDAIVAGDRARALLEDHRLADDQRAAIGAFADAQAQRAESRRPIVAHALGTVRSRPFRELLARAVAGMGHIRGGGGERAAAID